MRQMCNISVREGPKSEEFRSRIMLGHISVLMMPGSLVIWGKKMKMGETFDVVGC